MPISRRTFLQSSALAAVAAATHSAAAADPTSLLIAPFRFDVTPPVGHPLCGGWIKPAIDCDDELEAIGFVLLGADKPIVICAVDWTGILNEAHVAWRSALAEAAGTTPDRVAVQCVHQHDAPFVCLHAERLVEAQHANLQVVEVDFFRACLDRAKRAIKVAIPLARPITHIAHGEARVEKVAGNRRLYLTAAGKVGKMRGSSCRDPELIALPEGLIDPQLKTIAFYSGNEKSGLEKIVACHYYATHPMSHYGAGHVSSDFVGLARKQIQREQPACTHIYFTGCAGNIAAGKYNDGSPEARLQLTQRIYDGMASAEKTLKHTAVQTARWRTTEILPPTNPAFEPTKLREMLENSKNAAANRIRPAMTLGYIDRLEKRTPIILSALDIGGDSRGAGFQPAATLLHLPAECFVEYQLRAQQMAANRFLATAAYGDGGPWYIPTQEAYPLGGYEVSVANCSPAIDNILTTGIKSLLT
jgi:hypothetical protein